jgi:hypothetical protein
MAVRLEDEIAVLGQARARLEALLEADENWRALVHRPPSAGEQDAARRARDQRLEMALAGNVVYQAWRHVGEAIAAVKKGAAPAEPPCEDGQRGGTGASELPEDIAELLRARSAEEARRAQPAPPEPPLAVALAAPSPPLPSPPASSVAPPPTPPQAEAEAGAAGGAEPESVSFAEATVEFVALEPAPPAPGMEGKGERRPPLRERLRELAAEPEGQTLAFTPPQGPNEEADVTILTADAIRERRAAEERARAIGRFRKALFGE